MNIKGSKDVHWHRYQPRFRDETHELIQVLAKRAGIPPNVLVRHLVLQGLENNPLVQKFTQSAMRA